MNTLLEAIKCFMLREALIKKFEKEITKTETFSFEAFLRKGMTYIVRGKVSKKAGIINMLLKDSAGLSVSICPDEDGTQFSVTPGEEGTYTILTTVDLTRKSRKPVRCIVALYEEIPIQEFYYNDYQAYNAGTDKDNSCPIPEQKEILLHRKGGISWIEEKSM